jgi:predicted HTH transcriptional regulator
VVLPNLNQGTDREVSGNEGGETVKAYGTPRGTINETIGETIKSRPGISRAELIALVGRSRSTVARAVAELIGAVLVERRGSKKTGGYYSKST